MRKLATFVLIGISLTFCSKKADKPKIDKFIWIQHNLNWIWDTTYLQARKYIEYIDSTKEIHYAKSKLTVGGKLEKTDYFCDTLSDTLNNLIISNLYKKTFPETFKENPSDIHIYDGDYFCIIYKFKNDKEHIINYLPYTLPDSLKKFTTYVEGLAMRKTFKPYKEIDIKRLITKYKKVIVGNNPLAPRPFEQKVKFTGPFEERNE